MKFKSVLYLALCGLLSLSASAETTIKILHLQKNPKIIAIWQEAADQYEKAHPGVKVKFDYLENEAFKAKLPTLLQSKDRPSLFHSWGGGKDLRITERRRSDRFLVQQGSMRQSGRGSDKDQVLG
jgi:raffinose/stachyose/melibiose transport system substrate-binding protein